jgi:two-component system OmpR family response regulator
MNVNVESDGHAARVLVIDDEPSIVDAISITLRHRGYLVRAAQTGKTGLSVVQRWRPDVVVLDVMLPDIDGFEVARQLAAEATPVPILFLSALDSTDDKVRGLTIGGYDYVTKPFSLEELLARLQNILRRTDLSKDGPRRLTFADLELDEATTDVFRAGELVELTTTEFRLLRCLMLSPQRVLSREQLLGQVWGYDFKGYTRVLETYISYLRKKIDRDNPPLLHTVRGIGYVLRLPRG